MICSPCLTGDVGLSIEAEIGIENMRMLQYLARLPVAKYTQLARSASLGLLKLEVSLTHLALIPTIMISSDEEQHQEDSVWARFAAILLFLNANGCRKEMT